ncbi:hypothetical protein EYC84_005959 [Monilinia fructicola]|uniref:Uncharacterized protein n=1 Tax=Monilinia fructicola TaxID=38448 RepID=A0A5M9K6S6_MONFR|nr:hypothetical protein EYC84_005959 [Monilinia fructicola]
MSTNYDELASMEELDVLMDEIEASRAVVSATAAPTTSSDVSVPVAVSSSATPATSITPRANTTQSPSISAKPLASVPAQKLSRIPVWMEERNSEEPESLKIAHFDDASLANCAVPLSFDDSGPAGGAPSLSFAEASELSFTPEHQRANTSVPYTSGRGAFASSQSSSVAPRAVRSLQEVITISFPTIEDRNCGLERLEKEKDARNYGTVILIRALENEKQVEVSGPVGSNIRGFVRKFCPDKFIQAQIKQK